ncbi:hypothetical protein CEXT_247011 [Caerostris extrusa]|uniref:Uncharacterized protein n=1 Tax=Caerostris extrusa TaxID=172846 RepID=A0AAV4WXW9_CAEEX|nr:hypothetical protein CEXT_247011 [Caerostris extrusa]
MIFDQLKKKVSLNARVHFVDVCCDWLTPEELVYGNLQTSKGQRENWHVNDKYYPKQPESDKKQYHSNITKLEYLIGLKIPCDRTYKRSTAQKTQ